MGGGREDDMEPFGDLTEKPKELIIDKNRYSAFYKTNLNHLLQSMKIEDLIICGVMTNCCCETTARGGFMRGFEILFTIDGTATYHEDFHRATLMNLAHGFASPVLTSEILSELNRKT